MPLKASPLAFECVVRVVIGTGGMVEMLWRRQTGQPTRSIARRRRHLDCWKLASRK